MHFVHWPINEKELHFDRNYVTDVIATRENTAFGVHWVKTIPFYIEKFKYPLSVINFAAKRVSFVIDI